MKQTKIEWCDYTFNPWVECPTGGVRRTSALNWKTPVKWNRHAGIMQSAWAHGVELHGGSEAACIAAGFIKPQRPKVLCRPPLDVFDALAPAQWRADLLTLMEETPNLDWLLPTEYIGNVMKMGPLPWVSKPFQHGPDPANIYPAGWPENVWLGASIVEQGEADRDISKLLAVPAAKRFLSLEPLLGPVDLCHCSYHTTGDPWDENRWTLNLNALSGFRATSMCSGVDGPKLDWVIVGGQSGPGARPMHPDWVRSLRDQCKAAGVPFLFTQWGEWAPHRSVAGGDEGGDLRRGRVRYLQGDGREPDGHFRKGDAAVARVGKKAAGRLLNGITHDGYPA